MNEHSETLRAAYDFDAPRRNTNVFDGWRTEVLDAFLALLPLRAQVLELGAGAGQGAAYVAAKGFRVTAIDLSPANVALAVNRGIDASVGDFTNPDFFIGEFDGLYAMNSVLHVKKDLFQGVLKVIRRSLCPGGIAQIVVWGGLNHEGPFDDEWTTPPRFFAIYTDDDFASLDTPGFERLACEFRHEDVEGELHPQILTLRAV
jgi:SAM-dependent methyltransferase